jgi:hypothetical protein
MQVRPGRPGKHARHSGRLASQDRAGWQARSPCLASPAGPFFDLAACTASWPGRLTRLFFGPARGFGSRARLAARIANLVLWPGRLNILAGRRSWSETSKSGLTARPGIACFADLSLPVLAGRPGFFWLVGLAWAFSWACSCLSYLAWLS